MRWKQFCKKGLAVLLCASFLSIPAPIPSLAESGPADAFHYGQIPDLAARFYDGLLAMETQGLLQTGTADYDLVANGHLTEAQAEALLSNQTALSDAMNEARYAFYADHPEVFYVDFPKLTYRMTKDGDGKVHIYLGPGRRTDYRVSGFSDADAVTDAIQAFDTKVNEIAEGAENAPARAEESLEAAKVRYVHNAIIDQASYRLEDACYDGNDSFLGTPYGVLVKKQGVCEGYARAFKTVLDELGIRSILVQGVHRYDEDVVVAHMWNYVELDGKWYAVDLTQDDPECIVSASADRAEYLLQFDTYGLDGFENEKYLLAGASTMDSRHFVKEEVEAAGGYSFTYPDLETADYLMKETLNDMDGFKVTQKTVSSSEGFDVTEFGVSYLGMNATDARKQGIYFLARYYDYDDNEAIVPVSPWGYLTDDYALKEDETSVYIQEGQVQYMEFAVTRIKPRDGIEGLTYIGDEFGLIARTGKFYNENQTDYMAPPYVKKQTPSQTATLTPNHGTYHVTASFTEPLALTEDTAREAIGCRIECKSTIGEAVSGAEQSTITNVTWDGDATVSFDITFSKMFADNSIAYDIYLTGLVGATSKKIPNPIVFSVRTDLGCPSIMNLRGEWRVFGKPTLMANADLSVDGWKTADGASVSEKLQDRLALVTSKPSDAQNSQMNDVLEQTFPEDAENLIQTSTYNINLVVCKLMVISTGHKVQVLVGFPDGCGPDDAGTTYKAYHFKRDAAGNVSGVEEIDCVVTPYGLIVTCDAFSPFLVAAVESDEPIVEKTVILSATEGGTVTGDTMTALAEGESASFAAAAEEGYVIESITVCGKSIPITDSSSMEFSVSYGDVGTNNLIQVQFVHQSVIDKEEDRGEVSVPEIPETLTVQLPESVSLTDQATLTPTVSMSSDAMQYQWFKDGTALEGETGRELTITEAGTYEVLVTVTVGAMTTEAKSNACTVVPAAGECEHKNQIVCPAAESTCTVHGHAAYTACKDCGKLLFGSKEELPLLPHVFVEKATDAALKTPATCKAPAVYFKSCETCGMTSEESFSYGDPAGHGQTEVRNERPATCETDGYTGDTVCTVCDEVVEKGEVVKATGHRLEAVPGKEPTHEEAGVLAHYVCANCKKLFLDANGTEETTCEDVIQAAKGHEYGEYESDKYAHWKTCSCGQTVEKGAHEWVDQVDAKYLRSEATCSSKASYAKSCKICGAASTKIFFHGETLPHTMVLKNSKAATCDRAGYTGDHYCSECGYKVMGTVVPATGHTLVSVPGKEATHTEAGSRAYEECSVCGGRFSDPAGKNPIGNTSIPPIGHTFGDYQADASSHWRSCSCGDMEGKGAHEFSVWSTVTKPTATEPGEKVRTCVTCGYEESLELPAYGTPVAVPRPSKPEQKPTEPETTSTAPETTTTAATTAAPTTAASGTKVKRPTASTRPSETETEPFNNGLKAEAIRPTDSLESIESTEETEDGSKAETKPWTGSKPDTASTAETEAGEVEEESGGGFLWLFVGIVMIAGASLAIFFAVRKQKQLHAEESDE